MSTKRRSFLKHMGIGIAGMSIPVSFNSCTTKVSSQLTENEADEQLLHIGENIAVADTAYGKVRGYILRDIYYFLGIPYGADTAGENRFMPPRKPTPWNEVYPAVWWGNSAPQPMENRYENPYASFRDHWNYDDVSEDCLKLNVFTPGYGDGKKRPVLVWMHGGGFRNGNAIEQDGYNGENLARFGDVVFCSVNHRLGPLGFTDLSSVGGEDFQASGNVGMLDLVAALEWVRDNIENFGGDPDNVTIMGQSGGGAKVTTTTAMPAARGLFGKAVVLSGAGREAGDRQLTKKLGEYILKEAGLTGNNISELQQIPWKEYYEIAMRAAEKLTADTESYDNSPHNLFRPVMDGTHVPRHPYSPDATPLADQIPMIICSTTNEFSPSWDDPSVEGISLAGVKEKLRDSYGDKTDAIVDAFAGDFPDRKPVEIWSIIRANRQRSVELAEVKAGQEAPVYLAWFGWQPPLFDNRMRAFHCLDISFWFYNTDQMLTHTGGGARPRRLSEKMAASLINFMKTGDPNVPGLPEWPEFDPQQGQTMLLDDVPQVQNNPDKEARSTLL